MFNKLKIGTKLALSFGVVIVLLLLLTGIMAYCFSEITKSTDRMLALLNRMNVSSKAGNSAQQMRRDVLFYVITHDSAYDTDFQKEWATTRSAIDNIHQNTPIEKNKKLSGEILELLVTAKTDMEALVEQEKSLDRLRIACGEVSGKVNSGVEWVQEQAHKYFADEDHVMSGNMELDRVILERALFQAQILVQQILIARDGFIIATEEAEQEKNENLLKARMGALTELFKEIKDSPELPKGAISDRFDQVMKDRETWEKTAGEYLGSIKVARQMRDVDADLLKTIRAVIAGVEDLQANASEAIGEEGDAQDLLIDWAQILCFTFAGIAFLGAVALGWLLTVSIAHAISRATGAMRLIANDGNVAFEIPPSDLNRGDEIGAMAHAVGSILQQFQSVERLANALAEGDYTITTKVRGDQDTMNIYLNKMLDQVNHTLREINNGVGKVTTGSTEVSNASQTLSDGAQQAAASLEEITASMSEISSQTKTNAESAVQARDLAQKTSQAAAEGQEAMQKMTGAMEQITKNSSEIQRVIKVIDDIAFQTNLLALNAAVEAARAGQHGKGFAVVAEEVRNLASRSAKAAQETSDLIAKSGHEIEKGGEIANHTASVLNTIVEQIKQTTDLVAGIAIASNEQAEGVNQVSVGLQQIDVVTQQNTASAEESASAAGEMSSMAANLQKLVGQFKLR